MKKYNVAVVGATGEVGQSLRDILDQRQFPIANLSLLASARSAGKTVQWGGQTVSIENLDEFDFSAVDVAFFSAGASVSKVHAPRASESGAYVIDNTSCFRYDDDKPLVVPEVNPQDLNMLGKNRIIANPNCSTIQMVVALNPIYQAAGITRINIATYQAVSGSGAKAIKELEEQVKKHVSGARLSNDDASVYSQPIAFNVLPHIDVFLENGYSKEEMKMVWETRKIIGDPSILVNPTCVRVPVSHGHSEAVHLETRERITASEVRALLENAPGVKVVDNLDKLEYPTPLMHAKGTDPVFVGRIRQDISSGNGINMWIVSDNIRKGAALNSVQIAELLVKQGKL